MSEERGEGLDIRDWVLGEFWAMVYELAVECGWVWDGEKWIVGEG